MVLPATGQLGTVDATYAPDDYQVWFEAEGVSRRVHGGLLARASAHEQARAAGERARHRSEQAVWDLAVRGPGARAEAARAAHVARYGRRNPGVRIEYSHKDGLFLATGPAWLAKKLSGWRKQYLDREGGLWVTQSERRAREAAVALGVPLIGASGAGLKKAIALGAARAEDARAASGARHAAEAVAHREARAAALAKRAARQASARKGAATRAARKFPLAAKNPRAPRSAIDAVTRPGTRVIVHPSTFTIRFGGMDSAVLNKYGGFPGTVVPNGQYPLAHNTVRVQLDHPLNGSTRPVVVARYNLRVVSRNNPYPIWGGSGRRR